MKTKDLPLAIIFLHFEGKAPSYLRSNTDAGDVRK